MAIVKIITYILQKLSKLSPLVKLPRQIIWNHEHGKSLPIWYAAPSRVESGYRNPEKLMAGRMESIADPKIAAT